jgi:hypothetical protein
MSDNADVKKTELLSIRRFKNQPITASTQKAGFSVPKTILWLIKVWFSTSTFVVKIDTFAKPENVSGYFP